jgi:hypothetical protein
VLLLVIFDEHSVLLLVNINDEHGISVVFFVRKLTSTDGHTQSYKLCANEWVFWAENSLGERIPMNALFVSWFWLDTRFWLW